MSKKSPKPVKVVDKKKRLRLIILIVVVVAALICGTIFFLNKPELTKNIFGDVDTNIKNQPIYSGLTGLEISSAELNSSPTFCVQIPNGSTDGARPQAGLDDAAVVFEAIAEAGITRFAAVFQNPTVSVIGPIRSLRSYYLDWDTPFDCTVVHAGGSDEALSDIAIGGQRNLDENYDFMWRETTTDRSWNNLFTSPALLQNFNNSYGYSTSNPKTFSHLLPSEVSTLLESQKACQNEDASADPEICNTETASEITVNFSNNYSHNVIYEYNPETNTYLRSHQDGEPHQVYHCEKDSAITKTECGDPVQIAPSAIAIMSVYETDASDNYHQNIKTIGNGEATIFQNGNVIKGTWSKSSQDAQIVFKDQTGEIIKFTPGQLWISALPQFGNFYYE